MNTQPPEWEKEFDKKFRRDHDCFVEGVRGVKEYITRTLRTELKRELEGIVEKLKEGAVPKEATRINNTGADFIFLYDASAIIKSYISEK